jgi:hypothetical protein
MTDPAELTEITIKRYLCRHIHTSGRRCGSPALRGEHFCYYHHTTRRPAPRHRGVHPSCAEFELPAIDDRPGVQFALAQVLARIASNQLDHKRSGRLLNGLFIASRNLQREPRPDPRSSSRSSRHSSRSSSLDSASSVSADNSNNPEDIVEELVLDSDLGPIAPIAEAPTPEAIAKDRRSLLADYLTALFPPNPTPIPDPTQRESANPTGGGDLAAAAGVPDERTCSLGWAVEGPPHLASNQQSATNNPQPATNNPQPTTVLPTLRACVDSSRASESPGAVVQRRLKLCTRRADRDNANRTRS